MGPFKCPECGVWWAGFEHACRPGVTSNTTTPFSFPATHCHGCGSLVCNANDHRPCSQHDGGWSTT